jgi:3,4-dihydroxy-2-butanone 4-phosphate synthase
MVVTATLGLLTLIGAACGQAPAANQASVPAAQGQDERPTYALSDPVPQDPALQGAIDMHAHQDPDSNGPSYGQAARSVDAIDLYDRAKAAGMRGFVIKQHLDQTAGLAYYMRKLHPDLEIFGGIGSNLTTGPKVNPWAIRHMTEIKGGWGRVVWMPSWDSEHSSHEVANWKQPAFISVARCADGSPFWAKYPTPCAKAELLPEVKEAISVITMAKTRDSNGDLVLATGHNGPEEVKLMVEEAVRAGVKHIIITHPRLSAVGMNHAQIKEIVSLGPEIYAEFTSQFGRPTAQPEMVKDYVDSIRAAGVEHAFVSSDTGQLRSPFQPDALAAAAQTLRKNGFTERELDLLFKINPAKILGLPVTAGRTE